MLSYDEMDSGKSFYSVDGARRGFPVTLVLLTPLSPGASYKFQLDVVHADSDSMAEVDVTVNAPPACTELSVSNQKCSNCQSFLNILHCISLQNTGDGLVVVQKSPHTST